MSKLTESFRTLPRKIRVLNSHGFYGMGRVYISYTPNDYGRGGRGAYWAVVRPGYKTDPNGHWLDHGNKTFYVWAGGGTRAEAKAAKLAEAQEWACEKYGITEWARDPLGSYGDTTFVKARVKELRALVRATREEIGE